MEQVFDLREFIIYVFKKFKLLLILAVVLGIAGGVFGYASFPNFDKVQSNATATVMLVNKEQNATALESAMKMITSYITSDTFYTSLLNELSGNLQADHVESLFSGDTTPKLDDVKEVMRIFTKGNIVVVEIVSSDPALSMDAANLCIEHIIENVPMYNDNVQAAKLSTETLNITKQNNDSALRDAIKFGILGFGGGAVLGILIIFFADILDIRVKRTSDLKRYNIPVLSDDMDRAVAMVTAGVKEGARQIIVLTTSSSRYKSDIKLIGNCLQNSMSRIGIGARVVDTRGKAPRAITPEFVQELYKSVNDTIIVCCDCITSSTDALYYTAGATGVILCEEKKLSRIDEIGEAIEQIDSIEIQKLGFIMM